MQTFLPYADFAKSAASLDMMRLGKQRVETYQILQKLVNERLVTGEKVNSGRVRRINLSEPGTPESEIEWAEEPILVKVEWDEADWRREPITTSGWDHHPAKVMWEGHELALLAYQEAVCNEWVARGYRDGTLHKSKVLMEPHVARLKANGADAMPPWLGLQAFHDSHKSNLLRKDPDFYSAEFGDIGPELEYYWPSKDFTPEA